MSDPTIAPRAHPIDHRLHALAEITRRPPARGVAD